MVEYLIELRMAEKNLPITARMEELIADCTKEANHTVVSRKNKRTFSIKERIDEYTLIIKLQGQGISNPTRTMSTLTRAVCQNEELYSYVKNHIVNGMIFNMTLLSQQNSQIIHIPDTEIISEVVAMFFKNDFLPKEKELAESFSNKIRALVIEYKNEQMNL
ncbi:MAG: hypothetical protein NC347_12275 [Clostridium sp.]|nr:hypothetical protein [Clostridium sp.]